MQTGSIMSTCCEEDVDMYYLPRYQIYQDTIVLEFFSGV